MRNKADIHGMIPMQLLNGFPRGTKATAEATGLFKEVKLARGRPVAPASQDS